MPEYIIDLDYASGHFKVSSGVILSFSVISSITFAVAAGSAALVSLHCYERLQYDDSSLLRNNISLGVVHLYVLALFFGE